MAARGRNCTALAQAHPLAVDTRISFIEKDHSYWLEDQHGRRLFNGKSVTGILKDQFEGGDSFESSLVIKKNLASWRNKPSSKYGAMVAGKTDEEAEAAVKQCWDQANALGTKVHLLIEQHCNGVEPLPCDLVECHAEYAQYLAWRADFPTLQPWRTELSLLYASKSGEVKLCGQLDALFRCNETGKTLLIDWKRVNKRLARDEYDFGRCGKGVMAGLPGNDRFKYSLQLHIYGAMCEHHGIHVDALYILRIHPATGTYALFQAIDLAAEARAILQAL